VARFEFLAVLYGLEEVLATDHSDLPLHVFSDCESTVSIVNRLCDRKSLKEGRYEDRADLLPRLATALAKRIVHITRHTGANPHHHACHRAANRSLKAEIGKDPNAYYRLALNRQRTRIDQLIKERGALLNRLAVADKELSLVQAQFHALEYFLQSRDIHTPDSPRQISALPPEDDSVVSFSGASESAHADTP
jgi:hypothetical protein